MTKKNKGSKGKQKGAAFERKVCKELSLWVSNGNMEDVFWRSAMSGGRSTVALKQGKRLHSQTGDISSIHKKGSRLVKLFILELKHYKDLDLQGIFNHRGSFLKFWEKVRIDSLNYNKQPILIAKQNYYPTLFCTTETGLAILQVPREFIIAKLPAYDMNVIYMKNFLRINPIVLRGSNAKRKRIKRKPRRKNK